MNILYTTIGKVVVATLVTIGIAYQVLIYVFKQMSGAYRNEMFMIMFGSFIGGMIMMFLLNLILET